MREVSDKGVRVTRGEEALTGEPVGEEILGPSRAQRPQMLSVWWSLALLVSDIVLFVLSSYVSIGIAHHAWTVHWALHFFVPTSLIFIAIWIAIFERFGLYKRSFALSTKDEVYYTAAALTAGMLPLLVAFTLFPSISTSRLSLVLSLVFSFASVSVSRAFFHYLRKRRQARLKQRIAIVGTRHRINAVLGSLDLPESAEIERYEIESMEATLEDVVSPFGLRTSPLRIPWFNAARVAACSRIILTEMLPPQLLPRLITEAGKFAISMEFAMPRLISHGYSLKLRADGYQALLVPSPLRACTPTALLAKRLFDVAVATTALTVFAPIILLVALAIWLEDRGPVFYKQGRVGRNGVLFDMLKFRSMRVNAEEATGPTWVRAQDDRVTRVGRIIRKYSIDEVPQLINVLRGEMSIVGPRPERPVFVDEFRRLLQRYDERHLVRPGITGWSQIHMRRQLEMTDISEKLRLDLFYLENWSLSLDLSLLIKTAFEFLFQNAR
jgi:exopolysaccharide biosynthesis polyprenyl glycosylphosphotransferase